MNVGFTPRRSPARGRWGHSRILLRTVVRGSVAVVHGDESAVVISYSTRVLTATCPPEFPSEMTHVSGFGLWLFFDNAINKQYRWIRNYDVGTGRETTAD